MAKLFNRAIQVAGEKKKVGTPIVTIVELDGSGMVTKCFGATLPTDNDNGYAVGCIFTKTTGVVGASVYINEGSTANCDFNAVAASSSGFTTWDALYANDQTLPVTGATFTFDGQHASNDVVTITSTGAGSGDLLQITNVGSGKDVNGTNSTWSFTKTGVNVMKSTTIAGTAGSNSITLTAGDTVFSDGSLTITDADDAATLSITNDTATTASVFVFAGAGAFSGNTTSSFMTITPSGLTSGTAVYLPLAALTTGKGIHIVANAMTDGLVFNITSSSAVATATGRLFNLASTAATNTSHIIAEMATAANDETILLKLTASDALATGKILQVSGASVTTGFAIDLPDLAALTSGIAIKVVSSATAITGAGRLLSVYHSGATTSTGTIVEFKTDATDAANATTLCKLTMGASIVGVGLSIVSTTGMTTGSLIRATTSTAGAVATNGVYSFAGTGNFTSTADTLGMFHVTAASTAAGTILSVKGGALTTGIAVHITDAGTGITSGSLLRIATATTGAVATNGVVSIRATGAYTSTSNAGLLDVQSSGLVGTGTLVNFITSSASQLTNTILNVEQSGTTINYTGTMVRIKSTSTTGAATIVSVITDGITSGGTAMKISATALTTGVGLSITASGGTAAITTGSLLRVATDGTGAIATNGIVSFTHTGAFTSTSAIDGGFVEVKANSTTAGTIVNIVGSGLTTGVGLMLSNGTSAMTTGSMIRVNASGTGAIATNGIISLNHAGIFTSTSATDGGFVEIKANATTAGTIINVVGSGLVTGIGMHISNGTAATTSGSLLRVTAGGTGAVATNGIVSFVHTGVYTSASAQLGMFHVSASATTAGTVASISGGAVIGGTILSLSAVAATLTTGRYISAHDGAGEVFGIGANGHIHNTVGATAPTIAVTQQNGITAAAITAGGSDTCGIITTTGTNNNGGTTILQVTFNKTYTTAPKTVTLMPRNASGALNGGSSNGVYISAITATTFDITIPANASAGATPSWSYLVIA